MLFPKKIHGWICIWHLQHVLVFIVVCIKKMHYCELYNQQTTIEKSHMIQYTYIFYCIYCTVISENAPLDLSLIHSSVNTAEHVIFLPLGVFWDHVLHRGKASVCVYVCTLSCYLIDNNTFISDHILHQKSLGHGVLLFQKNIFWELSTWISAWNTNWMQNGVMNWVHFSLPWHWEAHMVQWVPILTVFQERNKHTVVNTIQAWKEAWQTKHI